MLAIGSDELGPPVKKGDLIECDRCGSAHPLQHGIDIKTGNESTVLGFVACGERTYVVAAAGRFWPKRRSETNMTPGSTHWRTCWRFPEHHYCAVTEIKRLFELVRRLEFATERDGVSMCAACGATRGSAHLPDCWIAWEVADYLE